MKDRWKKQLIVILGILITGCSGPASANGEISSYSLPQTMILVATERNRYQNACTEDIWSVTMEDGRPFDEHLLDQIRTFLQNMKTMSLLAKDQNITLSSAEKDQLRRLAETYYDSLTQADLDYMGIQLDDVSTMYQEYYLANKIVGELTKDINLEVSDSEAKVITIEQMEFTDADTAAIAHEKATAEDADFSAVAKEYTDSSPLERQLARGEEETSFEQAAFGLATGEISPVIASGSRYYILHCISDYDESATSEHKSWIYNQRKNQVFQQIYDQFQANQQITFSDDIWDSITISSESDSTTVNFFDLYAEEFGSQSY